MGGMIRRGCTKHSVLRGGIVAHVGKGGPSAADNEAAQPVMRAYRCWGTAIVHTILHNLSIVVIIIKTNRD